MEIRNRLLRAHHDSPGTERGPNALAPSFTLTYALLIDSKWYGDLTANCSLHGIRPVDTGRLTAAIRKSGQLGKLKTILF